MSKHVTTVSMTHDEIARINRLLEIESLENMTDDELLQQGANTNQHEDIYCAKFDDGSTITFALCSGTCNYWDDVVWTGPDGITKVEPECTYEFGDIELKVGTELYIVKIVEQ